MFKTAFLAATVLPLGSEALYLYLLASTSLNKLLLFFLATIGNSLGSLTTYLVARSLPIEKGLQKLSINLSKFKKIDTYLCERGVKWSFFCWLPIFGDVIAFYYGFKRVSLLSFSSWMTFGKAIRYLILWAFISFY